MRAILIDVTRCRGCNRCVEACTEANRLRPDPKESLFDRSGLSGDRFTTLVPLGSDRWVRRMCVHCLSPSCEAACLVGALHRTPEGPVVYDASKCIGCRYCMLACPFSVPRYEWDKARPFVRKCEMCHDRPGGPACVAACPHDATQYGEREELLRVARARIRENPGRYQDRIWGEEDAGGTSVLFLTDVPLDPVWPVGLGKESVPELTWPVVRTTPFLVVGVAGILSTLTWIVHRRNRLAEARAESSPAGGAPTGGSDDAA